MAPSRARARFQADVQRATETRIPYIQNITKGDAEDEIVFTFSHHRLPSGEVRIGIMPQDIPDYPDGNLYLAYTKQDIGADLGKALEDTLSASAGMRVVNMLINLSQRLSASLDSTQPQADGATGMKDADIDDQLGDMPDDSDSDVSFEYGDEDDLTLFEPIARAIPQQPMTPAVLGRIRRDFLTVRKAGCRVGRLCGFDKPNDVNIASVATRVSSLYLSEETREAWNLDSSDYVVLLVQYKGRYVTFEDAIHNPENWSNLEFRLRKCSRYRPAVSSALAALRTDPEQGTTSRNLQGPEACQQDNLMLLRIGTSIDNLLNHKFIPMLKLRERHGISWDSANLLSSRMNESIAAGRDDSYDPTLLEEDTAAQDADNDLPPILQYDHLASNDEKSLPLVATQLALRYLVRCTNYCTICHKKVEGNFEALKPYVCSNSLCLFQYMSLGFGPSIDTEILNQPLVVDLLISFCYAALTLDEKGNTGLRELPKGLSLQVPKVKAAVRYNDLLGVPTQSGISKKSGISTSINGATLLDAAGAVWDWDNSIATLNEPMADQSKYRRGTWVIVFTFIPPSAGAGDGAGYGNSVDLGQCWNQVLHHARVEYNSGAQLHLRVAARHTLPFGLVTKEEKMREYSGPSSGTYRAYVAICDQNLDDLEVPDQAFLMKMLLNSLPTVAEMRAYLLNNPTRQLSCWDRITPAAMGLLRWIVASNLSYIKQVDEASGSQDPVQGDGGVPAVNDRILGVKGWTQFRFAQGSPEKEAQFNNELSNVRSPVKTLVAWHGSPLRNWHSIIRQGLDYSQTANGRAYGHGVYFSREFETSAGYSDLVGRGIAVQSWPYSALNIVSALSLNELVNQPQQFVHSSNYLVVQHCHWIQCRYLFVRSRESPEVATTGISEGGLERSLTKEFKQDPMYTTKGPNRSKLFIPVAAIPSANKAGGGPTALDGNRGGVLDVQVSDDDDPEDANFLFGNEGAHDGWKSRVAEDLPPTPTHEESLTDFRPGSLDLSRLPQLAPPSYATDAAQRVIGRELRKLQQVQSSTPIHELGWYIDFDKISNMFQWIVEFHSFEPTLPLARDMRAADISSIVLEVRLLRGFPLSPPFVRVIRPRFLPFVSGGGGHVTSGGAMCMELLTNTGWSPANSMESVLLQVRMAICSCDPKPARLQVGEEYGVGEAVDAYKRAAAVHGWEVPGDLHEATLDAQ
ncbi:hypothetical protein F4780DRAFT_412148 [Xylariomycetidae sp. FL0641]|nr:hypothetical protein F4780DRAFT_412148 [Xylariomycetidae sp. FL0641]